MIRNHSYKNYEYSTRNETISANSPVASARANPRIAYVNSCPRSAGFRAVDEIRDEKIDPIPIPAPVRPIAARPAPMYFAAAMMFDKVLRQFRTEPTMLNTSSLIMTSLSFRVFKYIARTLSVG
jgi:hypothetical protein